MDFNDRLRFIEGWKLIEGFGLTRDFFRSFSRYHQVEKFISQEWVEAIQASYVLEAEDAAALNSLNNRPLERSFKDIWLLLLNTSQDKGRRKRLLRRIIGSIYEEMRKCNDAAIEKFWDGVDPFIDAVEECKNKIDAAKPELEPLESITAYTHIGIENFFFYESLFFKTLIFNKVEAVKLLVLAGCYLLPDKNVPGLSRFIVDKILESLTPTDFSLVFEGGHKEDSPLVPPEVIANVENLLKKTNDERAVRNIKALIRYAVYGISTYQQGKGTVNGDYNVASHIKLAVKTDIPRLGEKHPAIKSLLKLVQGGKVYQGGKSNQNGRGGCINL